MPFALLLALAATAGATLLTYLYDRETTFPARVCAGVCMGLAALGLLGFIIASLIGLNAPSLFIAGALAGSPLLLLIKGKWRERVGADLAETRRAARRALIHPGKGGVAVALFYCGVALVLWLVFDRAMFQNARGIFTGASNNLGDLPFHLAVIHGFLDGANFPPQHPEFAGVRLTYPFIVDFLTAMFMRAGASLQGALFWQNFVLALALVGVLHRWALALTRDSLAGLLTPVLVLLSGGFGWIVFLSEAAESGQGVIGLLTNLPKDYTIIPPLGYRWGNAVTTLLIPQRSWLLGIPLALIVFTLWWKATDGDGERGRRGDGEKEGKAKSKGVAGKKHRAESKARRHGQGKYGEETATTQATTRVSPSPHLSVSPSRLMLAAGVIAGLMPLAHAHSFAVMMGMGGLIALGLAARRAWSVKEPVDTVPEVSPWSELWAELRPWAAFFAVALALAVPQLFWATRDSGMKAGNFIGFEIGWEHGTEHVVWFWIKNTGLFIPLLFAALLWRGRRPLVTGRLLCFYLPFTLCFIVPNLFRLSPWLWDNIKILFWWWIASAMLVALLLARLWRSGMMLRGVALLSLLALTLAGALDVWRTASGAIENEVFGRGGVEFAEVIKRETPPRSLILHAPTYNDPVYLTGRRTYIGYIGHLWSHGIDYAAREAEMRRIYTGAPDAVSLIERSGIEYVVVGPLERAELLRSSARVNETFFQRYTKVGETGEYRLYKTRP